MKRISKVIFWTGLLLCNYSYAKKQIQANAVSQAEKTLIYFLNALHDKRYEEAAQLYGDSYSILYDWNPDLPKNAPKAMLWRRACEINGFRCLAVRRVVSRKTLRDNHYEFELEFSENNGTLFDRGQGRDNIGKAETKFIFVVKRRGNNFAVMDPPIFAP